MYYEESGAYTGEVAPNMIKEAGCEYVILGHSERRGYFGETDEIVNLKVKKAFEHDLIPIICVGETLEQRSKVLLKIWCVCKPKSRSKIFPLPRPKKAVIAYEPIWAIGTVKQLLTSRRRKFARQSVRCSVKYTDRKRLIKIRIQYGGSVNAANAADLFAMPDIDGGLVAVPA